jgi:transposase
MVVGCGYARKKLEKGTFRWPEVSGEQNKVQLSHEELTLLVGGIDLREAERRRWYRREVAEPPAVAGYRKFINGRENVIAEQ